MSSIRSMFETFFQKDGKLDNRGEHLENALRNTFSQIEKMNEVKEENL